MKDPRDFTKGMTAHFNYDLRDMPFNPLNVETPFGRPTIVAIGNAFDELDDAFNEAIEAAAKISDSLDGGFTNGKSRASDAIRALKTIPASRR
jgi:hypothetical protein